MKLSSIVGVACVLFLSLCSWSATPPTVTLFVDASSTPRKIFHAKLKIPASPGDLTLYYPKWIPGEHAPDGPVIDLAGLKFTASGKTLKWRRDLLDGFTIHVQVPAGESEVNAELDFLSPATFEGGFSAGSSATDKMAVISWNQVLLYPKGWKSDDILYVATLKLPAGWKYGTPLPIASTSLTGQNGDTQIIFQPVSLTTLVDSPVITGEFLKVVKLADDPLVEMDIAADSAAALAPPPEVWDHYKNLVEQANKLFGAHHYRDYHFLYSLSDHVAHFGLEHHESDDSRVDERGLVDDSMRKSEASLLPHEYVHSWNGKYRRPAGLATPDYQQPMQDDLLWVYEGLTNYLGTVLTARSELLTSQQAREALALLVAQYEHRPGRDWRPLQDTADAAPFLYDSTADWANWRRGTDFYEEGELLWLDVDSTLRMITNDKKSIDDFCKIFHGGDTGKGELKTYTFEDVVATLNQVAPYDWTGFLRARLDGVATKTPEEALTNSGWRLEYNDQPNTMEEIEEGGRGADLTFSIGLMIGGDGSVVDVIHDGPAYKAGIGPGMKIVAVNGAQYSADGIHEAIDSAKTGTEPITIITSNGARFETRTIDYHGGVRYPHIVRDE